MKHSKLCHCTDIDNKLNQFCPDHKLLTPCIVVDRFISDFDPEEVKSKIDFMFNACLVSREALDLDGVTLEELFYFKQGISKLLEDLLQASFMNRDDKLRISKNNN